MGYTIDARKLLSTSNIVIYGAQNFFNDNFPKLLSDIKPKYIYPNGEFTNAKEYKNLKILNSIEDIKKLDNPFVLIAIGNEKGIKFACDILKTNKILFDHMGNYCFSDMLYINYLLAMETYRYIDIMNNCYEINEKTAPNIRIYRRKKMGHDNSIYLRNLSVLKELKISLWGNNSIIDLQNSSVVSAKIEVTTNGKLIFGNDCMISFDVFIGQADQHHIFDATTGQRINHCKGIYVGNHVWIGKGCVLLDGAYIEDGSIMAAHAVTSHHFNEKNVIIAGVPGKIIRKDVLWSRDEQGYDYQTIEECHDKNALKYL